MIELRFYGLLRLESGIKSLCIEAGSIKELYARAEEKHPILTQDKLKNCIILINGKRAKASYDVKTGDVIAVTYGERTLKFKVLDVREHVAKADAASMYEIINE